MDKSGASNRKGSGFPAEQHRNSVSWTDIDHVSQTSTEKNKKATQNDLGKEIGLLYGGSLVINTIIGPGIFGTPKGVLLGVGSVGMSLVMWTFTGMFSMCAALCFAELRESVRREGVEYAYITEAFGPIAGFAYSWMRIAAAEPMATAVFALVFTDYVSEAIYDECGPDRKFLTILSTLAVLSMFLMNVMSTKLSERFQMLSSVGKFCSLSVIIIMGVKRMIEGQLTVINEGFVASKWSPTNMGFALYNGLWSYGGWANVNHVTSGIKKPPRNVPRIAKTTIPIVMVIYVLTVLSFFTAMTREEMIESRAIGVTWAQRVLGPASSLIAICVGLVALGNLNATFLSAGRLCGVAAKNGQMPDVASWVHVRSKTPLVASGMRCIIAIVVMIVADVQQLLRFYIFVVWLFHGTSIVALLILRYKNKKKRRPYKVDLWIPVVVVAGIGFMLVAPFLQKPETEFIAAVSLLGICIVSYYPITWLKKTISVPDLITIWLQLFLRIAPKRDLRREKKTMMRQMSFLCRNSIIVTPNALPSPAVMRRFSRHLSPALIRRLGDDLGQTSLRRRMSRGGSLADINARPRMRSNSTWSFGIDSKASPAIIRKKTTRHSRSFSQADVVKLKSPASLPILKNHNNTTLPAEVKEDKTLGSGLSVTSLPQLRRPSHSPIPEEDSSNPRTVNSSPDGSKSHISQQETDLQVLAGFESDGGGEYEILAHPDDVRGASFNGVSDPDSRSESSSSSDSESSHSSKSKKTKKTAFSALFNSSASTSSDSETSSTDDDDLSDEERNIGSFLPQIYVSEEEVTNVSSDKSKDTAAYVNKGFVSESQEELALNALQAGQSTANGSKEENGYAELQHTDV